METRLSAQRGQPTLRGRADECALLDTLVDAIRRGEGRSLVFQIAKPGHRRCGRPCGRLAGSARGRALPRLRKSEVAPLVVEFGVTAVRVGWLHS